VNRARLARHIAVSRGYLVAAAFILMATASPAEETRPFKEATREGGELKYIDGIPVLFLQGEPEDVGRQYGLLFGEAARPLAALPKEMLKDTLADTAWPVVVRACRGILLQAPERFRREIDSAARAAGLSQEEKDALIVANMMYGISSLPGCSALIVEPQRSTTAEVIFGRNLDLSSYGRLDRLGAVVISRPKGMHAFAAVGLPGFLGVLSGMNDAGLAVGTHSADLPRDASPGFNPLGAPLYLTVRRILEECATIEEAEKLIKECRVTAPILLAACDRRRAVVFEITTKTVVTRASENHLLICTNHYRTPELSTRKDCDRYRTLVEHGKKLERLGWEDVARAMRQVGSDVTLQTMVFEPGPLRLRVALGELPVMTKALVTLDLSKLFRHDLGLPAK
jgi:isopenicillin-N N-acyltransferase-like protein